MLLERQAAGRPVTVGVIGAGKFGTMYLAQARTTAGTHVVAVADLNVSRAKSQLAMASWPDEQSTASSLDDALLSGRTFLTDDTEAMIRHPAIEVIVEATGDPKTGIRLSLLAIENGKHIVMVNVEADALAGPLLARRAREAGIVYSLAWGDQPALVCEHVDWAQAAGLTIVAAGKGTRYHRATTNRRPTLSGTSCPATCASRTRIAAPSTRRCSTPSWTAPSPASR